MLCPKLSHTCSFGDDVFRAMHNREAGALAVPNAMQRSQLVLALLRLLARLA